MRASIRFPACSLLAAFVLSCGGGGSNGGGAGGAAGQPIGGSAGTVIGSGGTTAIGGGGGSGGTKATGGSGGGKATGGSGGTMANTGTGGSGGGMSGEPTELAGIVELHNAERRALGLPELTWDDGLAAVARAWTEQCIDARAPTGLIDHNTALPNNTGYTGGNVGENIYGNTRDATAADAVGNWIAEKADYNYASNTCAMDKVCGHYTQVVWRNTRRVGCVLHDCAGLRYRKTILCNYSPAGNVRGQKPY